LFIHSNHSCNGEAPINAHESDYIRQHVFSLVTEAWLQILGSILNFLIFEWQGKSHRLLSSQEHIWANLVLGHSGQK
jgi:hypothetical protein